MARKIRRPNALDNSKLAEELRRLTSGTATHLTPAEVGRLLGKSSHVIRDMIVRGDLTQERVDGRWLIPIPDVDRALNPQRPSAQTRKKRSLVKIPQRKRRGKRKPRKKSSSSKQPSRTQASSLGASTHDLAAEVSYLEREKERLSDEIRSLKSGLMSDEKRRRLGRLQAAKKRKGRRLRKLRSDLSRREARLW
jgi:hypothetical protein